MQNIHPAFVQEFLGGGGPKSIVMLMCPLFLDNSLGGEFLRGGKLLQKGSPKSNGEEKERLKINGMTSGN